MKKSLLLLTVLLLVTATVTASAVFEFKHHQNVTNAAVVKAQKQRDEAESELAAYQLNVQSANAEVKDLAMAKSALCQQLTGAKLKSTYCQ